MRSTGAVALLATVILVAASCEPERAVTSPLEERVSGRLVRTERAVTRFDDPVALLDTFRDAFVAGDIAAIRGLLDPRYRYLTGPLCAAQATCGDTYPWDAKRELEALRNMMDPGFSGPAPPVLSRGLVHWVQRIDPVSGGFDVRWLAEFTILTSPYAGWSVTTFFDLEIREGRDGGLRIRTMRELGYGTTARGESCWASIQCQYAR